MTTLCKIENGIVANRAYFDGDVPDDWAPDGEMWVANDDAHIGDSYADGVFIRPPQPETDPNAPPPTPSLEDRIAALEAKSSRTDALEAVLIQKGTISADALDAAVAQPVDMKVG